MRLKGNRAVPNCLELPRQVLDRVSPQVARIVEQAKDRQPAVGVHHAQRSHVQAELAPVDHFQAEEASEKRSQGAGVGHAQHGLVTFQFESADEAVNAQVKFIETFAAGEPGLDIPGAEVPGGFRIGLNDFVEGQALELAEVNLADIGTGGNG